MGRFEYIGAGAGPGQVSDPLPGALPGTLLPGTPVPLSPLGRQIVFQAGSSNSASGVYVAGNEFYAPCNSNATVVAVDTAQYSFKTVTDVTIEGSIVGGGAVSALAGKAQSVSVHCALCTHAHTSTHARARTRWRHTHAHARGGGVHVSLTSAWS